MKNKKLAIALTVLLSIPVLILLVFTFGEVFSGDSSGIGHLIQALPFLVLIYLVWKWPSGKKR